MNNWSPSSPVQEEAEWAAVNAAEDALLDSPPTVLKAAVLTLHELCYAIDECQGAPVAELVRTKGARSAFRRSNASGPF